VSAVVMLDMFGRPVSWLKFSSSGLLFLVPHFSLDEWMNCSLVFFSASFAIFARVLFFIHPLGLYTSIRLCHMKVWGSVSIYVDKYSTSRAHFIVYLLMVKVSLTRS
jgi:hypothetical protein